MRRSLAILCLAVILAACGGQRPPLGGSPEMRVLSADQLPLPQTNAGPGSGAYVVQPGDKLVVDAANLPGLAQREVAVDRGGRIALPMVGGVEVAGRTAPQIEALLVDRLRAAFVREPRVAVNIGETASQLVTVDGQVVEPGVYPVFPNMTLTRAVASAKGGSEFARLDDVVVLRTVDGQRYAALYNLGAIQRGAYVDPPIVANDVVIVGESSQRRLIKNLVSAAPALVAPLVVLLQ